ncbi:MAG: hydrogenase maturation peptidase HycI [Chloroflexi bacterium]|nr:hydrogenase maturation peptidase HycI [Chloroflexota bacterium]
MSVKCWKTSLSRLLNQSTSENKRIAIVGIGNEMRGDDAAGMLVAQYLHVRIGNNANLLVIEGGHAPENATGALRKFSPDFVLLIDAADMGEEAGTIALIPMEQIDGISASTHSLPLSMLTRYLTLELNCEVALLGIQSKSVEMGASVSDEVNQAVKDVVEEIFMLWSEDFSNPASMTMRGTISSQPTAIR